MRTFILHHVLGHPLFETAVDLNFPRPWRVVIERAIQAGINLDCADLHGINLSGVDLRGISLPEADLSDSNLSAINLSGANLARANLARTNLAGADLSHTNLISAYLTGADLTGADLIGSNLHDANLANIRADVEAVLNASPDEVSDLLQDLEEGKVDGSMYEGDCACLVGTLARSRGCDYRAIPGLTPDSTRPAERWFLGISQGDTPESSEIVSLTVDWVSQWLERRAVALLSTAVDMISSE